jgi:rhodanese-related sulfurtransferase
MTDRISAEELEKLKSQSDDVVILDVRPSTSFESGHIAGALSVPLYSISLKAAILLGLYQSHYTQFVNRL